MLSVKSVVEGQQSAYLHTPCPSVPAEISRNLLNTSWLRVAIAHPVRAGADTEFVSYVLGGGMFNRELRFCENKVGTAGHGRLATKRHKRGPNSRPDGTTDSNAKLARQSVRRGAKCRQGRKGLGGVNTVGHSWPVVFISFRYRRLDATSGCVSKMRQ